MNWSCSWLLTGGTSRKNSLPSLVIPEDGNKNLLYVDYRDNGT